MLKYKKNLHNTENGIYSTQGTGMHSGKVQAHEVRGVAAEDQEQFTCFKHDTNFHHVD